MSGDFDPIDAPFTEAAEGHADGEDAAREATSAKPRGTSAEHAAADKGKDAADAAQAADAVLPQVSTALVLAERPVLTPAIVYQEGAPQKIIEAIRREVLAFKPDISTKEGRAAIASLAHRVSRSKTALDDMGKELNEEFKRRTRAVDAERKKIRDKLDAIRDLARKPLDDWEEYEAGRLEGHKLALAALDNFLSFGKDFAEPTAAVIAERIATFETMPLRDWQEFTQAAAEKLGGIKLRLDAMLTAARKREADAAELAELRRQQQEREERERAERIEAERLAAIEAERKATEERERAEQERIQLAAEAAAREATEREQRLAADREQALRDQQAEAERQRLAEQEQAEAERRIVEQQAQEERERLVRERQEADADRLRAEERAAAAQRESEERAERARQEERDRQAAEQAETKRLADLREANIGHARKINNEVVAALREHAGLSELNAKAVVKAIASKLIVHTAITY